MQAIGEGHWNVGICQSSSKRLWIPYGAGNLSACGCTGLVPICFRVPNQAVIQPSFQQRASDSTNSGWWQEEQVKPTHTASSLQKEKRKIEFRRREGLSREFSDETENISKWKRSMRTNLAAYGNQKKKKKKKLIQPDVYISLLLMCIIRNVLKKKEKKKKKIVYPVDDIILSIYQGNHYISIAMKRLQYLTHV
jgi:hypothetical protein